MNNSFSFLIFISIFFLVCSITGSAVSNSSSIQINSESKKISYDEIKTGEKITCIKVLEREMKISDEHFKNIVKLRGEVIKKEKDDVYLKIEIITSKNLIKENNNWVKDETIVKRPPFTIGKTYPLKEKNEIIDNAVSKGYYKIFFTR